MSITIPKFKNANNNLLFISAFIIIGLLIFAIFRDNSTLITLHNAEKLIKNKEIKSVLVSDTFVYLKTDTQNLKIPTSQISPALLKDERVQIKSSNSIFIIVVMVLLFVGIVSLVIRLWQKKVFEFKKANGSSFCSGTSIEPHEEIKPVASEVSFKDIGGINDVKIELEEIIDFLKHPKRYKSFGARLPRGVLLVGPPGVGKTMIAKAVAAEAKVPFFYQSGASFVQIYVGMGAKRVHDLFSAALRHQPAIIFIDEIDAIGKKREGQKNDEREATLNQLLTEMDGFENSSGIIVIAATNKIDVLDEALLRSGRFDRRVFVELPSPTERASILEKYLQKIPNNVNTHDIAKMTLGFNGASLAALVNEAALFALRNNDMRIEMKHIDSVKDKVQFGKKQVPVLTQKQRECRAIYQAGKALFATWHNLHYDKILLTSDSFTPPLNEPMLKSELLLHIQLHLAGMAACNLKIREHDSFAKNDVDVVKNLLYLMNNTYAMHSQFFINENENNNIIDKLFTKTSLFLEEHCNLLDNLESVLLENESVNQELARQIIEVEVSHVL